MADPDRDSARVARAPVEMTSLSAPSGRPSAEAFDHDGHGAVVGEMQSVPASGQGSERGALPVSRPAPSVSHSVKTRERKGWQ